MRIMRRNLSRGRWLLASSVNRHKAAAALGAILSTGRLTGANGGGETGVCPSRSSARRGARMAVRYCSALKACLKCALVWDKAVRRRIAFLFLWLCLANFGVRGQPGRLGHRQFRLRRGGALSNPKNDAALVAATLGGEGFKVTLVQDASRIAMLKALRSFSDEADQADWALVYYAGHGIEVGGVNYLLPIDVELREDRDAQDEATAEPRARRGRQRPQAAAGHPGRLPQ